MKNKKRFIALALALSAALCLPSACLLAGAVSTALAPPKDEVIYVNLTNDGSVDSAYAVNSFTLSSSGTIVDYGDYTGISNLTTTDEISYQGDKVSVSAPKGKFYYQGNLKTVELPWLVSLHYRLDGKPMPAEELAGKNGAFELEIDLRKNPKADTSFFENYALQVSVTLDAGKCSNIVAAGATAANAGASKMLNYIIFPNTEKTLKINASVIDFSMAGIQISGIPLSIDIELPDISELTDQFTDLQNGVQKLNDGAGKLNSGVGDLAGGVGQLHSGVQSLCDGAGGLASGAATLVTGAAGLHSGSAQVLVGVDSFGSGLSALDQGSPAIASSSTAIKGGLETLAQQLAGLGTPPSGGTSPQDLVTGSAAIKQGLSDMSAQLTQLSVQDPAVVTAMTNLAASTDPDVQTLLAAYGGLQGGVQGLAGGLSALCGSYAAIDAGIAQLAASVGGSSTSLAQLAGAVAQLSSDYAQFDQGLQSYVAGISGLNAGFPALRGGVKSLDDGTAAYLAGIQQFAGGTASLHEGAKALVGGTGSLANGVHLLKSGTTELANGTGEFRNQTSGIDKKINDEMDKMLEDFRNEDFVPISFLSVKNKTVASVQFVMKTPGITAPEKVALAPTATPAPNALDKLIRLFVADSTPATKK